MISTTIRSIDVSLKRIERSVAKNNNSTLMGSTYFPPDDNYGRLGFKLYLVTINWSSREEEEEEISKSLRHFEMSNDGRNSVSDSQVCVWDEEEQTKCCLRYLREEAKIKAWVNLQTAKATQVK